MKLLTHNMLQSHIKNVKQGYPFKIEADKIEVKELDYDPDFLRHIYPRINWNVLKEAAEVLGETDLPEDVSDEMLEDEEFLQKFHHALLEVCVEEGNLVCPETGRKFSIHQGIPNLLLHEDEV